MGLSGTEKDIPIDLEVVMHHDVSHAFDSFPGNLRMFSFQSIGQIPCCFTDNHKMTIDV